MWSVLPSQLSLKPAWIFLHCPQKQIHGDIPFLEALSEVELKASVKELDFGTWLLVFAELSDQAH